MRWFDTKGEVLRTVVVTTYAVGVACYYVGNQLGWW
jgi:hypothetical protein